MNNITNNRGRQILNQEIRVLLEEHLNKESSNYSSEDFDELIKILKPYQNEIKLLETYSNFLEAQINHNTHSSNESLIQLIDLLDNYYKERLKTESQNNNFDIIDTVAPREKRDLKQEAQTLTDQKLNLLLQRHCWKELNPENPNNWIKATKFERKVFLY